MRPARYEETDRPVRADHAGGAPESERVLLVTQVRSAIGSMPKHRGTLRALGLRRLGQANTLPDRPEIRGMLARVPHLVSVTQTGAGSGTVVGHEAKGSK
ncbi:MAG: 50S ribosomal protein L30 [Acidimicrobiales bacterium]